MRILLSILSLCLLSSLQAQENNVKKKKQLPAFKWVNEIPNKFKLPGLRHGTFKSPSMEVAVGYCIYIPKSYKQNQKKRFPVVYYLHGGRPGSEVKSVRIAKYVHQAMEKGDIEPALYVFVNGGPVSHYNLPELKNHMGEDIFIKELIPHIDKTYRTITDRSARGVEGFSQGGRGTTRIMFKYPNLFSSCSPGGSGYATEKKISEENGMENPNLVFAKGYNTWDLARKYNEQYKESYPLDILIHVGTKGFNYQNNLEYMTFLDSLKIPYRKVIVEDAPHSASIIYDKKGSEILKFHSDNFTRTGKNK
ncbi:MAG: esterase family protein [Lentisphaerales bacterium]|nr:esterase family protein [Lentisphaerales bacterium]